MVSTAQRLQRLVLSANEIKILTKGIWPDALVEDYLNILEDLITLSNEIDQLVVPGDADNIVILDGSGGLVDSGVSIDDISQAGNNRRAYFYGRVY